MRHTRRVRQHKLTFVPGRLAFVLLFAAAATAGAGVEQQDKTKFLNEGPAPAKRSLQSKASLSVGQKAEHVLNRLGYGPRPGDIQRVLKMGVRTYVERQLNPERIDDSALEARLEKLSTLGMSSPELVLLHPSPYLVWRILGDVRAGRTAKLHPSDFQIHKYYSGKLPVPDEGEDFEQWRKRLPAEQTRFLEEHSPVRLEGDLQQAKVIRAVHSERQLQEQMVDFWMNHFNVYMFKGWTRWQGTSYERDAIRPYALGNFRDLLLATARHPAMLVYLDNFQSSVPGSPGGMGLNENYGREILELHTLGVDGGYTQKDVVEVARCLTGWTIRKPDEGGNFFFDPAKHDNGEKIVLGRKINAGGGEQDGITVIDMLVRHPSTAHFIATKLARRFVADQPPEAVVKRAANAFSRSGGSIRETLRAIFTSPEFFSPEAYRAKVKKPFEFAASALRAAGADIQGAPNLSAPLPRAIANLGEELYLCAPPTGYPDVAEAWINSGLMLNRLNFVTTLAEGKIAGVKVNPSAVQIVNLGRATQRVVRNEKEPAAIAAVQLGAPEFQRR